MSIKLYVGTSGWSYDWNLGKSFDWYIKNSQLNSVELNSSFYRFPLKNQVLSWRRKGYSIRWSIKVHRSITHVFKLGEKALNIWFNLYDLFKPMDDVIAFYLFQLPPSVKPTDKFIRRICNFYKETGLGSRFAIEFRNKLWYEKKEFLNKFISLGLTIVSIDSPMGTWILKSNNFIYLRMHGKIYWYNHYYSDSELREILIKIMKLEPEEVYVFFNNNHDMLENAQRFLMMSKRYIRS